MLADEFGQLGDLTQTVNAIEEVLPKSDAQAAAGLLQTSEGVAATAASVIPYAKQHSTGVMVVSVDRRNMLGLISGKMG